MAAAGIRGSSVSPLNHVDKFTSALTYVTYEYVLKGRHMDGSSLHRSLQRPVPEVFAHSVQSSSKYTFTSSSQAWLKLFIGTTVFIGKRVNKSFR